MNFLKSIKFALLTASLLFNTAQPHTILLQVLKSPEGHYLVFWGDWHEPTAGFTDAENIITELIEDAINSGNKEAQEESDYESDNEDAPNNKFAIIWECTPITETHDSATERMRQHRKLTGIIENGRILFQMAKDSNVSFYAADPRLHNQAPFVFKTKGDILNFAHCALEDLLVFEQQVKAFDLPDEKKTPAQQLKNMLWKKLFADFSNEAKTLIKHIENSCSDTAPYSIVSRSLYNILFKLECALENYSFLYHIINYDGPALVCAGASHLGHPESETYLDETAKIPIILQKQNSHFLTPENNSKQEPPIVRVLHTSPVTKTLIEQFGYTLVVNQHIGLSMEEVKSNLKSNPDGLAAAVEEAVRDYILYSPQEEVQASQEVAEPAQEKTCEALKALANGDEEQCKAIVEQLKKDLSEDLEFQKDRSEAFANAKNTIRQAIVKERFKIDSIIKYVKTLPWKQRAPIIQTLLGMLFMANIFKATKEIDLNNPPKKSTEAALILSNKIEQSIQENRWEHDYHAIIPTLSLEQLVFISRDLSLFFTPPCSTVAPSAPTTTTTTTTLPSSSGPTPSSSTEQPAQLVSELDAQETPAPQAPLPSAGTKHGRDEDEEGDIPQAKRQRGN